MQPLPAQCVCKMIPDLVQGWEEGNAMVITTKRSSGENPLMFWVRKRYYGMVNRLSSIETFQNFTGFGLYDRRVIDIVRAFDDPYPYFRGILAEIGLPHKRIEYDQPARKRGLTTHNFYSLYDYGMLGVINHSKVPLRLMTFSGFVGALLSFLTGMVYLIYKLLFWNKFSVGIAPVVIGLFFVSSILLVFMGIIGEYAARFTPRFSIALWPLNWSGSTLNTHRKLRPRHNPSCKKAGDGRSHPRGGSDATWTSAAVCALPRSGRLLGRHGSSAPADCCPRKRCSCPAEFCVRLLQ